jgi:hypothetical protein
VLLLRKQEVAGEGEGDARQLAEIAAERSEIRASLRVLIDQLNAHDERVAELDAIAPSEDTAAESEEGEVMVDCMSCGREIALARAARHFLQCFRKVESELSFAGKLAVYLPECPVPAFCNHYNRDTRTYCGRFAALCPEHGDNGKLRTGKAAICGYRSPGASTLCHLDTRHCPQVTRRKERKYIQGKIKEKRKERGGERKPKRKKERERERERENGRKENRRGRTFCNESPPHEN